MDKMLTIDTGVEPTDAEMADYKATIAQMFAELQRLGEQTTNTQAETERLRVETRTILARLKAA